MKRLFWVILAIILVVAAADAQYGHGNGNFGLFYSSLSPHGEWIEMGFGTVWRPYHVGHQWRPYMQGRWIWTSYGWYWNSYEPFGWATYHYGRWIYDDYYGWIWAPDDVWGPAWVEWRYDDDYVGWAPLPPYANFSVSVGVTFGRTWVAPVHYWNFVPCGNFSSAHVVNYIQPTNEVQRIFGRTRDGGTVRTVDRRIVNDGVGLEHIERRSTERVRKADLIDRTGPGEDRLVKRNEGERLEVYRPGPEEVHRERSGQRTLEGVKRGRDARETQQGVQRDNTGQGTQQGVQRDRNGQGTQQGVQRDRTGQRTLDETMREKVYQRDRQRETRQTGVDRVQPKVDRVQPKVDRPKPEVKRDRPAVDRPNLEIRRPKPEGRRGREG